MSPLIRDECRLERRSSGVIFLANSSLARLHFLKLMNVWTISMLTLTARGLLSTLDSIATPYSVKAIGV